MYSQPGIASGTVMTEGPWSDLIDQRGGPSISALIRSRVASRTFKAKGCIAWSVTVHVSLISRMLQVPLRLMPGSAQADEILLSRVAFAHFGIFVHALLSVLRTHYESALSGRRSAGVKNPCQCCETYCPPPTIFGELVVYGRRSGETVPG